ncbi:RNA methyltransferase, TrmH family [Pasteurella multocida]|uniref:TrmH family RNA methyltransferase n=1 Tax=Pasteurella multocida TaxID=747 RepID=UPI0008E68309|nr:TrmH family RNA methyltransferase [Pasteurella multocida]MBF6982115.1 rRNA methyltransferase [Pasteurella multocida]MBM2608389.1 rRNA methyltransferase [Pasteurella multocida]MDY0499160.1 rRNA methyltransferase [Pasteurella multocida]MDY0655226.1 rRNA methyltransferase [Pasteurella multocida]MEB3475214.1 TrmH family RNA methyltransferase [Pasteurella multocida]
MNSKAKAPVFQQTSNKQFHERSVGEKSVKTAPHFKEKFDGRGEAKTREKLTGNKFSARSKPVRRPQQVEQHISETSMRTASGEEGKVKVVVKSTGASDKPREKKTGALSPRAPEKIKKNRAEEMKVYGENACQALFAQRPESIVRIWATVEMAKKSGELFSYLAEQKKAYHVVDSAELALVSGTAHHGGICMLVKKARPFTLAGYLDIPRKQDCLVLIDGVQNPHNLGGVVRTCAVFGVKGVVIEQALADNLNAPAAMRVAEGGMEYVRVLETTDVPKALAQLRQAGYQLIHVTANKQAKPLSKLHFTEKVVFVLNEQGDASLAQAEDEKVVLSLGNPLKAELNIAVATGILLAQWDYR